MSPTPIGSYNPIIFALVNVTLATFPFFVVIAINTLV